MSAGPDFLCVGMMKAGTGWLYDQLQGHPDFSVPPAKELHYFDRPAPDPRNLRMLEKRLTSRAMSVENGWRALTADDRRFFALAADTYRQPISLERYAELFGFSGGRLTGDITPAYSTLPAETVDEIGARFPEAKCLLLVRDPILRLWSQISMNNRRGKTPKEALEEPDALIAYVSRPVIRKRSFATETAAKWSKAFGEDRFRVFFFDDIVAAPDRTRSEILHYLGGDPAHASGLEAGFNRKADLHKLAMPDFARAALIDYFAEELRASAAMFGSHAEAWARSYGVAL